MSVFNPQVNIRIASGYCQAFLSSHFCEKFGLIHFKSVCAPFMPAMSDPRPCRTHGRGRFYIITLHSSHVLQIFRALLLQSGNIQLEEIADIVGVKITKRIKKSVDMILRDLLYAIKRFEEPARAVGIFFEALFKTEVTL